MTSSTFVRPRHSQPLQQKGVTWSRCWATQDHPPSHPLALSMKRNCSMPALIFRFLYLRRMLKWLFSRSWLLVYERRTPDTGMPQATYLHSIKRLITHSYLTIKPLIKPLLLYLNVNTNNPPPESTSVLYTNSITRIAVSLRTFNYELQMLINPLNGWNTKYLWTTVTNQNFTHEAVKRIPYSGTASRHSEYILHVSLLVYDKQI
jgi:hypothetical protein